MNKRFLILLALFLLVGFGIGTIFFGDDDARLRESKRRRSQSTPVAKTEQIEPAKTTKQSKTKPISKKESSPTESHEDSAQVEEEPEPSGPVITKQLIVLDHKGGPALGFRLSWKTQHDSLAELQAEKSNTITFNKGDGFNEALEFTIKRQGYEDLVVKRERVEKQTVRLPATKPTLSFKFQVVMPDGTPFPNGEVSLRHYSGKELQTGKVVPIDGAGMASVQLHSGFQPLDRFEATFRINKEFAKKLASKTLGVGDTAPHITTFRVRAPLLIRGKLVYPGGRPIRQGILKGQTLYGPRNSPKLWHQLPLVQTDSKGRFALAIPRTTHIRLDLHEDYFDGIATRKAFIFKQTFEIDHRTDFHDLGTITFQEMAKISFVVKHKSETLGGMKVEFAGMDLREVITNGEGKARVEGITKNQVQRAKSALSVRVASPEYFLDWTNIKADVLRNKTIQLLAEKRPQGTLDLTLSEEDQKASRSLLLCHFWRRSLDGPDELFKELGRYMEAPQLSIALPLGEYYGFVEGQAGKTKRSKLIEFAIEEGRTTELKPELHRIQGAYVSYDSRFSHLLEFEVRYVNEALNFDRFSRTSRSASSVASFSYFPDEPAELVIRASELAPKPDLEERITLPLGWEPKRRSIKIDDQLSRILWAFRE